MTEFIEINILKEPPPPNWQSCECFLCFDSRESEYIILKCCNKHNIHKECLFNIFIHYIDGDDQHIPCPLCRQELSIKNYFTLDECITLFMENEVSYRQKFMIKFNTIINYNYIDSNQLVVNIDETASIIINKSPYKKFAFTVIVFMLLILIVVGFKMIYS